MRSYSASRVSEVAAPTATTPLTAAPQTSAPVSPWAGLDETPVPAGPPPDRVGPYRIVDLLGEGGMGVVYRAEQIEPLRRDVAVKIVKRGIDTDRVVARFERERRVLARLDHPNVARVIDAGATADGRPYFVMELVAAQSAQGLVLRELRRLPDARRVLDAGVAEARRIYTNPHPVLATIVNNLALVEQDQKDYAGAEAHFREVLQIDRVISGARSADVASDLHNLAWFLHRHRGRSAEAETLARDAIALRRDVLGPKHPQLSASLRGLADILTARGRPAAAVPLYREAQQIQAEALPRGHRLAQSTALGLGEALTALGQADDAMAVLQQALSAAPPDAQFRSDLETALVKARAVAGRGSSAH